MFTVVIAEKENENGDWGQGRKNFSIYLYPLAKSFQSIFM